MELLLKIVVFTFVSGLSGWFLFSLAAGVIVYLSTLTTNHVSLEPKSMTNKESSSLQQAHTRDPAVMEPLNAAKARWYANLDRGLLTQLAARSADGLQLSACYWDAGLSSPAGTVLIVHGMYDSAAGMGYLAEEYRRRGWNVLSVDQRSHGESEGTRRTMGVREADDIGIWVNVLTERFKAEKIWLHGVSMGGAAVLLYGGRTRKIPLQIRGIIADSSYASYEDTFSRLVRLAVKSRFVAWSIVRGTSLSSFAMSGVSFSSMCPQKMIARIPVPVLLFHGQNDVLVPIGQVRQMLTEAVKRGEEMVVIPGAPHIGAYFYAADLYMQKIDEFCRRNT